MTQKAPATRVTDTINFITAWQGGTIPVPAPVKADIVTMINQAYPVAAQPAFDQMSGRLSVHEHGILFHRGDEDQRHTRRAIGLIYEAISIKQQSYLSQVPLHTDAMTMGTAMLDDAMDIAMVHGAAAASTAGAAWVFNYMFAHPLAFLRRFKLNVLGTTQGQNLVNTPPIGPVVPGQFQNVAPFTFRFDSAYDCFQISQFPRSQAVEAHAFNAVSVPAILWDAVPGRGNAQLPPVTAPAGFDNMLGVELAGAPYMVTTQFTGCALCYASAGPNTYAVHISPGPLFTGAALANQLMVGSSRVDLQACKLEYSIVSPK